MAAKSSLVRRRKPRPAKKAKPDREWTVMMYMAAATDDQTERAAIRDIKELQRVGSKSKKVSVLVQIDRKWPGYPQRYRVEPGVSLPLPDDDGLWDDREMSTGDPDSLRDFLDWSRRRFPAKRYMLVLWGHAYGLGFGRDHGDPLTIPELARVLKEFGKNGKLDLLGANACALSYAEAAYELRDAARYLVASEITMPFSGWPYSQILDTIVGRPEIETVALGQEIVDAFMDSFGSKGVALTLLNLQNAAGLREKVVDLAKALTDGIRSSSLSPSIVDAFLDSAHGDVRPIVDVVDLCSNLEKVENERIRAAARQFKAFARKGAAADKLVVANRADKDFEGLNGLGIFAQAVADPSDLSKLELHKDDYEDLELMRNDNIETNSPKYNYWSTFVYGDLRDQLEPVREAVSDFVESAGGDREDRTAVAQLVIGVSRSFVKLEKAIDVAESAAMRAVKKAPENYSVDIKLKAHTNGHSRVFLRLLDALGPEQRGAGTDDATARMHKNRLKASERNGLHEDTGLTQALSALEDALASSEQTINRVLTNGKLGLGGGGFERGLGIDLGTQGGKTGLGIDLGTQGGKVGLGVDLGTPGGKPGLGIDLGTPPGKPGMGIDLGTQGGKPGLGAVAGMAANSESLTVSDLFGAVAATLGQLELGMANLQQLILKEIRNQTIHGAKDVTPATDRMRHAFKSLRSLVALARSTSLAVLLHPTEGLGPTPPAGVGVSRQQLAAAAGLSPQGLRLL